MQFVTGGPDIPERLLQAHEDGRVAFFCGAGISYPAHLPDFAGLVKRLYDLLAPTPNAVQNAAIKAKQFDTAIGLLEAPNKWRREEVRCELAAILTPDLSDPKSTTTHEALLTLAKTRDGRTRLITTNFDRIFEHVIEAKRLRVNRFSAPLLPVPKNRWDGLVYLHGLLGPTPTPSELDRLVISSGDFGLAYLNERWASRFVSELFRNCVVCFVGYSINDPVLRYMMDALAADRLRGESPSEIFAFGNHSQGAREERESEWRAKNVTPILYREHNHHAYLHRTLHAWADTYRDGVRGKERIVVQGAIAKPLTSTQQDDFVGRVLWALSDRGGLPAKRFAEMDPVPSLDWLEPLSDRRFHHTDLMRFGIAPKATDDEELAFSLTCRPSPYQSAPWMALADIGARGARWDKVMTQLAVWLLRHLNNPRALLWLANQGGQLHDEFTWKIDRRLDELTKLEREGNTAELAGMQKNAPDAVPSPFMRTLWRLLITGRSKSAAQSFDVYRWRQRFDRDGLTPSLRLELREALMPRVVLREPFGWPWDEGEKQEPKRVKDLVDWDISLSADHIDSSLRDIANNDQWQDALPELLWDVDVLLRDALDLMHELGGADEKSDSSYMSRPSISQHPQNRGFDAWTALIDLTRDAWLATAARFPERATLVAATWWITPYPLFKRLAFFAASQGDAIPNREALNWLISNDGWWLWSVETEREAIRLLVALAPRLDASMHEELERAILVGPPRSMFKSDIEPERWTSLVDRNIWLRLAKLNETGASLTAYSQSRLSKISTEHPDWKLESDQRDEFPFWMGSGDDWREFVATPRRRRDLVEWLRQHPKSDTWQQDDWRERCRDDFPTTACALYALTCENNWPTDRWREALQAWSEEKLLRLSWHHMSPIVDGAPNEVLRALSHGVSWWLEAVAKIFESHEPLFFNLASRILELDHHGGIDTDDSVLSAINDPIGHVTEALLRWWYRQALEDRQGLPGKIKTTFTELCDARMERFRHGRVLLAAHMVSLFRVDPEWATEYLLPLFGWQKSEVEARAAWQGFLWSSRLYRPLMELLKPYFLDTASHYSALGKHGRQYASLLTFAALDPGDTFTLAELARATTALPSEGLHDSAQALVMALEATAEQRTDYWKNRVVPYIRRIWPKSASVSPLVATSFARLCIAAEDRFPEALQLLRAWLIEPSDPGHLIHLLNGSGLCKQFPTDALEFIDTIVVHQPIWLPGELKDCLSDIAVGDAALKADLRFQRLVTYIRELGQEWP